MKKIWYALTVVMVLVAFAGEFLFLSGEIDKRDASIRSLKTNSAIQGQVINDLVAEVGKRDAAQPEAAQSITIALPTPVDPPAPMPTLSLPEPTQPVIVPVIPTQRTLASIPEGATAACNDGTFYFRNDYKHVCQNHGGYWWWKYQGCTKDSC